MSHTPDPESTEAFGDGSAVTVSVRNVGGIDDCEVTLPSGVTILSGRNATNRSSLLGAISGALGGTSATLKTDASEGEVRLELDSEASTRRYTRDGADVVTRGDPFTEDDDVVDLFVSLLAGNPARRAVERGDDLRETIMEPVDTDEIQREIRMTERERSDVVSRIEEIDRQHDRLPDLRERKAELETELDDLTDDLEAVRETLAEFDADEAEAERADELLSELDDLRRRLAETRERIDHQETELETLESERETVAADHEAISAPRDELARTETEIETLRQRKRAIDNAIDDLVRIAEFNDDLLSTDDSPLTDSGADEPVTAELDPSSKTVECWTCGTTVDRDEIAGRVGTLRELIGEKRDERAEIVADIEDVSDRQRQLQGRIERKERLDSRLEEIDREIAHREDKIESLEADAESLQEEIGDVESRIEEVGVRDGDLLDEHERLSELEYRRGQVETELRDVTSEIESIESAAAEREDLVAERDELASELDSLRSRIRDIEHEAVEEFNEHMAEVLDLLDYGNITRVWIERKVRDGRGGDETTEFELHVVRETEDGSVYEDSVENLSESEREVIGLVVALAGYLTHDVYESVPVVLLDSLEAIDSERIAALVEYFAEYAEFVVVALLPEDERALSDAHVRIPASELSA